MMILEHLPLVVFLRDSLPTHHTQTETDTMTAGESEPELGRNWTSSGLTLGRAVPGIDAIATRAN